MESDEIISLTQKRLLRWTWMLLQDQIDDLARASFFEMFEENPDNLVPFLKEAGSISENGMRRVLYKESFFEIDRSVCREKINVHALCVVAMIDKGISVLDKPCDFVELLLIHGRRHKNHGVARKTFQTLGNFFIQSFKEVLEDDWTDEIEAAWKIFFRFLNIGLEAGYSQTRRWSV